MIVWINGTFGVGKATTANAIVGKTDWQVFDPEHAPADTSRLWASVR